MEKRKTNNKLTVICIKMEEFIFVENLAKMITNIKVDLNKEEVFWLECHEIKLNKSEPSTLLMKDKVYELEAQEVNI